MKSSMVGGVDTLDSPLEFAATEDIGDAVLTLTDKFNELSGVVTESSGKPGMDYTIIAATTDERFWTANSRRIATSRTSADGKYVLRLPPGDYNVRVEKEGFRSALVTQLTLNAASSLRADITLEVGQAQQTVEVTADAVHLQTDNAKSATTITQKLVDDLPTVVGGAMRRRKPVDAPKERLRRDDVSLKEVFGDHRLVDLRPLTCREKDRSRVRSERDAILVLLDVERLLSESIARQEQNLVPHIPDRESEHSVEVLRQVGSPFLVAVDEYFGV